MTDANRILGILAAMAGVVVWLLCGKIDMPVDTHTLSPQFFPKLLAAALILLGICLALRGGGAKLVDIKARIGNPRNLCLTALTLAYTLAFGYVDYRLLTPLYLAAAMRVLGAKRPVELILMPVVATAFLYVVFRHGFLVLLPELG